MSNEHEIIEEDSLSPSEVRKSVLVSTSQITGLLMSVWMVGLFLNLSPPHAVLIFWLTHVAAGMGVAYCLTPYVKSFKMIFLGMLVSIFWMFLASVVATLVIDVWVSKLRWIVVTMAATPMFVAIVMLVCLWSRRSERRLEAFLEEMREMAEKADEEQRKSERRRTP